VADNSERPRILGVSGHIRVGKTYAADYIGSRYSAQVFKNSKPIVDVVGKLGEISDRGMLAKIALAILDVFGRDLIARHWVHLIRANRHRSLYVVEGIRYKEEVDFYRRVADFKLLGIRTTDVERYRRAGLSLSVILCAGHNMREDHGYAKQEKKRCGAGRATRAAA
jgi:dephospho-CoA kinase